MTTATRPQVFGESDPRFASVQRLFERNLSILEERNAQLCVYVGGEKVIDLWGSAIDDPEFQGDSLINVFSSGKSLEAIAIAYLFAQGLLSYDDKVAKHWPEFAQAGKQDVTIADLMRHEAGLANFSTSIQPEDLLTANIKQNNIGKIIEAEPQYFKAESPREYHAITRGWIVNELFRRVDTKGRTLGEFLDDEMSSPLGADVHVGLPESKLSNRSPIKMVPLGYHFKQSLKPIFLGRRVQDNIFQLGAKLLPLLPRLRNRNSNPNASVPYVGMDRIEFFNEEMVARGETSSANAHCSARGLAKYAAMMASGGSFEGKQLISTDAWHAMHAAPIDRQMAFDVTFTQGGVAKFGGVPRSRIERAANIGREGFYGWMGLGGSIFQWHPEKQIGFAFVPTSLHAVDVVNERGKALQQEVLRCL